MFTPASPTLDALTTSHGAGVSPAFSNSSASGGWLFDDSYMLLESERETMFMTNSPVSSTLLRVSLEGASSLARGPTLPQSIGGWREATVKKLKGAKLRTPSRLTVEIQAMGRGATAPTATCLRVC